MSPCGCAIAFFVVVVLCSVDFVAVATFSAAFCNVTLSFRSDVVALLRGFLEFAAIFAECWISWRRM